jgi:hypothetical protein
MGQNKNITMVQYLTALTSIGKYKSIYHYFPMKGHRFLPCDKNFGKIEKNQNGKENRTSGRLGRYCVKRSKV